MKMENSILNVGDYVKVNFHNSQFTLCRCAKVIKIPCATGDCWVFQDCENGKVHYVSEGCTITKPADKGRLLSPQELEESVDKTPSSG